MHPSGHHAESPTAAGRTFASTLWTVVMEARDGKDPQAASALTKICEAYWYPLYTFVRRSGYPPHDAQDLTQDFFVRLLAPDFLKGVHPEKGRFRSYLLACLRNFMANEWKRSHRQKRGGEIEIVSLDLAESRYAAEPAAGSTPDVLFERRWALMLLDKALAQVRAENAAAGKSGAFEKLKAFLAGNELPPAHAMVAAELGISPAALKMAVSRLRRRYRDVLRGLVAETVADASDVDDEIRHLLAALR